VTEKDLVSRIDDASIAQELKTALTALVQKVELLLPDLPVSQRRRLTFMLDRLVKETTDATTEIHWWPVALDFVTRAANEQGETGRSLAETAHRLLLMLQQTLGPYEEVSLREITAETVLGICLLSETLTEPKRNFVAPNAMSLAQAHFNPHAWFRAIYAGRAPVGFVMMVDNDEEEKYFLWRFMIAGPYHGRGYGRKAITRLLEYVATRPGARELVVSCGQGEGSPEGFYQKLGFEHTGEKLGDEVVLRLKLA